jgi:hypothetical protein
LAFKEQMYNNFSRKQESRESKENNDRFSKWVKKTLK